MDTLVNYLINFFGPTPYFIILGFLIVCGIGLPIPEDMILFVAGLMSYYSVTNIGIMIAVALFGVILGDSIIFLLGFKFGRKITKIWFFHKLLPDNRLDYASRLFKERGVKFLFFVRFMPGLRAPVFFSAGMLHVPFKQFLIYNGGAALVSVPVITGVVYLFGDQLDKVIRIIQKIEHGIFFVILGLVLLIVVKIFYNKRRNHELR